MGTLADTQTATPNQTKFTVEDFIQLFASNSSAKQLLLVVFVVAFVKASTITNQQAFFPLFFVGLYYIVHGLYFAIKVRGTEVTPHSP